MFTIIISASPLWWWVSTERVGRTMIVIVIGPTLRCVFRVVRRCNHSNSAGDSLCPRGILLRRVWRWCRHRHIRTLQVIPFTLKLGSFPVLCFRNKIKIRNELDQTFILTMFIFFSLKK